MLLKLLNRFAKNLQQGIYLKSVTVITIYDTRKTGLHVIHIKTSPLQDKEAVTGIIILCRLHLNFVM